LDVAAVIVAFAESGVVVDLYFALSVIHLFGAIDDLLFTALLGYVFK
jgi:hypothetical protein